MGSGKIRRTYMDKIRGPVNKENKSVRAKCNVYYITLYLTIMGFTVHPMDQLCGKTYTPYKSGISIFKWGKGGGYDLEF